MITMSLAGADRVYECGASCSLIRHSVRHDGVTGIASAVRELQRGLGEHAEDEYWKGFLRRVRRCLFELCAAPFPLSYPSLTGPDFLSSLHNSLAHCRSVFPQFEAPALRVISRLEEVSKLDENPLLSAIEAIEFTGERTLGVVLKEPRLIPATEEVISRAAICVRATVVGTAQLRTISKFDCLVVLGPTRWFPDFVFTAPRAREIHVVHFGVVKDCWVPSNAFVAASGPGHASSRGRFVTENVEGNGGDATSGLVEQVLEPEDLIPLMDWNLVVKRYARADNGVLLGGADQIPCRIFLVESGEVMFLSDEDGDTSLVIDIETDEGPRIGRMVARNIRPGMFLLARTGGRGSRSDYIADVANRLLGDRAVKLRKLQMAWKRRLRNAIQSSDVEKVVIQLSDLGAERANESNLRNWVSARHIKTQRYEDFQAILQLVGLGASAEKLWKAMRQIDRAHKRAGQVIRRRLLREVQGEALVDLQRLGRKDFTLEDGCSAAITALRVSSIADEVALVPATRVSRLLPAEGSTWRR